HVLAGLERGPRELEMRVAGRADVDEIDIVAREQLARIAGRDRRAEFGGRAARAVDLHVRDADDAAARIAAIAGQVRAAGPRAGAKDADANGSVAVRHLVSPLRVRRADHDLLDPDVRRAVRDAVRLRRLALGVAAGAEHPPRAAIPE